MAPSNSPIKIYVFQVFPAIKTVPEIPKYSYELFKEGREPARGQNFDSITQMADEIKQVASPSFCLSTSPLWEYCSDPSERLNPLDQNEKEELIKSLST